MSRTERKLTAFAGASLCFASGFIPPINVLSGFSWGVAWVLFWLGVFA